VDDPTAPLREPAVQSIETTRDALIVRVGGELDLYNADQLRAALSGSGGVGRVVVDLSNVEFLDSTVLGVLVEAEARFGSGVLRLAAPQVGSRRALAVSGLDRRLAVHESVESALSD
jgi:anti-anti-sigma factor